jgi:predicted peptidase
MKKFLSTLASGIVLLTMILGTCAAIPGSVVAQTSATPIASSGTNAHVKSVTAITEVFGDGQKVTAVALEYDQEIDNLKLSKTAFTVADRTITNVYANSELAKAAQGANGKYVIIELSTADANASTLENNMGQPGGTPSVTTVAEGTGTPASDTGTPAVSATPSADNTTSTPLVESTDTSSTPAASGTQTPPATGAPQSTGGPGMGMSATRKEVKLSVTQVGDITTVSGTTYAADSNAMSNDKVINLIVDDFQQLNFTDPNYNNETLMYNLYVPKDYDQSKSYPMVLFMPDASATSTDPIRTLVQGLGAVIWASPSEQAKHEAFVLAPQYTTQTVNDNSETTEYLDITVDLIKSLQSQYNIDQNRVYTTGQSGGCMMSIAMDIKYPDLFAASLLVAGQWDAAKVAPMAKDNLWIIVSEGDAKAFPGMNAITAALEKEGAKISRATWNGQSTPAEFATDVSKMIAEGNNINYSVFAKGTTLTSGQSGNGNAGEHMSTWPIAYTIEGVRDWLFSQTKTHN